MAKHMVISAGTLCIKQTEVYDNTNEIHRSNVALLLVHHCIT